MNILRSILVGAAAGSVGTVALDVTTYADMAVRGRAASTAPATMVKNVATAAGIAALGAEGETADNRRSGVGALLGYANGLAVGACYGALRPALRGVPFSVAAIAAGGVAMALSDVSLTRAGATDPRTWEATDWLSDIVPHLVFGLALAATFDALAAE